MSAPIYYVLEPCCVGQPQIIAAPTLLNSQPPGFTPVVGAFYSFPCNIAVNGVNVLLANECYKLTLCTDPTCVPTIPALGQVACSQLTFKDPGPDCPDPNAPNSPCPCTTQQNLNYKLYRLIPCCGGPPVPVYFVNQSITPATYVYTGPSYPSAGLVPGCYTLVPDTNTIVPPGGGPPAGHIFVDTADFPPVTDPDLACNNPECLAYCATCTCTRVRYTGIVDPFGPLVQNMDYNDCEFSPQIYEIPLDGSWGPKTCMIDYVLPLGLFEVETFGDCTLDTATDAYECPPCYKLVDECEGLAEPIYTLSPAIQTYIDQNQIIQIEGSDVCWTPYISNEDCECAVDVNVSFSFTQCETCLNPKGYKLTECTTEEVIFTNQDLSEQVNQVVELDCGGCWLVEALDLPAPSTQPVTILTVFGDCKLCKGEYFLLEDCTGAVDPVITTTDLSAYVGKVIKLKYCPETCWEVSVSTVAADTGEVLVDAEFADCPECYLTFPCQCNTVTNTTQEEVEYSYYDCEAKLQTITLNPGQTSDKICMLVWENGYLPNDCECIQITISTTTVSETGGSTTTTVSYQAQETGNIVNGQPTYSFTYPNGSVGLIQWTNPPIFPNVWVFFIDGIIQKPYLTVADPQNPGCPLGQWTNSTSLFSTELCPPVPAPFNGQIKVYGDCIDGVCPRPEFPKRKVKPGYNSPVCTEDKYEKIVCNFSEWYYKDVLEQRYGIANCCPEELMKWEIKKEILDLEIMINPDYVCQSTSDCCTPSPIVYRGTCNSQ